LGKFPNVSLADARKAHQDAKSLLVQGVNPMEERRERKKFSLVEQPLFSDVALAWWKKEKSGWSGSTAKKLKGYIDKELKRLSKLTLDEVDYGIISKIMIAIEAAGNPKKAPPVLSVVRRIFAYAQAKNLINQNPTTGMKLGDLLGPMPKVVHRAAITDIDQLRNLIQDIDMNEQGEYCSRVALKLAPRLLLRPGEVRSLRWDYINFKAKRINLPEDVMKMDRSFIVPMSSQVIELLTELKKITGYSEFIFPSKRTNGNHLSKNVLTNRLRALGYSADIMSAHGFRSTSSTILVEELDWDPDIVDTQLAHLIGTDTRRAYIRVKYLKPRTRMMQEWSDYLEKLKEVK